MMDGRARYPGEHLSSAHRGRLRSRWERHGGVWSTAGARRIGSNACAARGTASMGVLVIDDAQADYGSTLHRSCCIAGRNELV